MYRLVLAGMLLVASPLLAHKTLGEGITELARQISTSATRQEKQRIAVLPFHELDGQATVFGTYVAEELVTTLFQLGNFKIVERQLLDKVLGELKVQQGGAIDPHTAKEIGRIMAVDAIVTGSITDLQSYVGVNCRLIDTTTGEVFGAAKTTLIKDEDVTKTMTTVLAPGNTAGSRATSQAAKAIATKDIGLLRVTLKSVLPLPRSDGMAIRWTFEFMNRDARNPVVLAMNAEAWDSGGRFAAPTPLRASVVDDRGGVWNLSSAGLGSIGFVRAGVHGRDGRESYSPTEIGRLLRLRDRLGRDHDDPSDGTSDATGIVMGYRDPDDRTPPPTFFPFKGNRFISGNTSTIAPGQTLTVTMSFHQDARAAGTPTVFEFHSEIVVGTIAGDTMSYSLHSLTFDRVSMPRS